MARRKKYFIAYATQTDLSSILFHNEIVDVDPIVWVLTKNAGSSIGYTLLNWVLIEDEILTTRSLVSYITQTGVCAYAFHTEIVTKQDPLTWLKAMNAKGDVQYILINWSKVPKA